MCTYVYTHAEKKRINQSRNHSLWLGSVGTSQNTRRIPRTFLATLRVQRPEGRVGGAQQLRGRSPGRAQVDIGGLVARGARASGTGWVKG